MYRTIIFTQKVNIRTFDSSQLNTVTSVQQLEVGEGDTLGVYRTVAPAAGHPVQPAHVNTAATPEGARPHHPAVGVRHLVPVVPVIADLKLVLVACTVLGFLFCVA